jgi:hypothetical protein
VQVFPGNPPLEFGGTTSGLIALDTKTVIPTTPSHKVSVTLASLGYFGEFKTGKRSAVTVFMNYQPSFLLKAVNETSLARLKKFDSNDLGIHWYLNTKKEGQLKVFNYSLRETYKFGYIEPTFEGDFDQKKKRNFSVVSFTQPFRRFEFSVNQGASFSRAQYSFATSSFNIGLIDYYTSLNLQRTGNKVDVKTGITHEVQRSGFDGTFNTYDYAVGPQFPHMSAESLSEINVTEWYVYAKYHVADRISLGAGIRTNFDYTSYQANVRHEFNSGFAILTSLGRYHKRDLEDRFIKSDQISMDLVYKKKLSEGTLSFFAKKVREQTTITDVTGAELYYKYSRSRKFQGQLSFTTLNAVVREDNSSYSSPYDLKYFIRANLIYSFLPTWSFSAIVLYRQGTFYNPVINTRFDEQLGVYVPTYAGNDGQLRLPHYGNISCNLSKLMTVAGKYSAVLFAALNNVIDRKNVRGFIYNFDYSKKSNDLLSGRTFFFGTVVSF